MPAEKTVAKAPGRAAKAVAAPANKTAPARSTAKAPATKAPAKASPAKTSPAKTAPAKTSPAKVAPVKVSAAKASVAKARPAKADPVKAGAPAKTAPAKATKVAATKATATKTAADRNGTGPAVPAGSDWTAQELAEVRAELVAELAEMQVEYDTAMHDLSDRQHSGADGAGDDQADVGSKTFEREQELSIAANRMDLMTQTQHAIERLDAGTYGFCESCGRAIPKARLKAYPMATLDVACKQREERR